MGDPVCSLLVLSGNGSGGLRDAHEHHATLQGAGVTVKSLSCPDSRRDLGLQ